jgi:signal transduction histidine kinase
MNLLSLKAKEISEPSSNLPQDQSLDLLKILSHDLRGSIVSMSAVLHILNRGCHEKVDDLVERKLPELIDKMGSLSSMLEESLQMVLALEEGDQREQTALDFKRDIIVPVLSEFALEISDRHLMVENQLDRVASFFIPAKINKTVLKMIFRNLLSNAVKYTESGGIIEISVKHGSPFCLLKIYNNGRPIAEGLREKLFSKPLPPTDRRERNLHGMGLGLHLAKRIMQKQGGEIWYEPDEEGSCFVIAIPVETKSKQYDSYVQGTLFS